MATGHVRTSLSEVFAALFRKNQIWKTPNVLIVPKLPTIKMQYTKKMRVFWASFKSHFSEAFKIVASQIRFFIKILVQNPP